MNCGWYIQSQKGKYLRNTSLLIWSRFVLNKLQLCFHNSQRNKTQQSNDQWQLFSIWSSTLLPFSSKPFVFYFCYREHSVCWLNIMLNRWETDHKYQQHIQIQWNGKQFEMFLFYNFQCSTTVDRIASNSWNGF